MTYNNCRKSDLVVFARAIVALTCALSWWSPTTAMSAGSRIAIAPVDTSVPAGTPTIPWVAAGDDGWRGGQALFEVADAADPGLWAKGWMAVTAENILIRVVAHHDAQLSSGGGHDLCNGDGVQFAIDPLGLGADQPPPIDVQKELDKRFGKNPAVQAVPGPDGKTTPQARAAAARLADDIRNARKEMEKENKVIADGTVVYMRAEDQDFCVGTAGANFAPQAYCYYTGHGKQGSLKNVSVRVARDKAAQLTTYDVAVPWSQFGLAPGLAPILKIAFQINNTNGKSRPQKRLYWGGGVGGRFVPWKFRTVALGEPPAGTQLCSLTPVKQCVSAADDYVEALAAVGGAAGSLLAELGGVRKSFAIPHKSGLQRYTVRAYPGALRGSMDFKARLVNDTGRTAAEAAFRVFDDSSANWYAFAPKNDIGPSVIGMEDWMDAPAGKHGFIRIKGNGMVFEDGTPVKFWGVGNTTNARDSDKPTARALAAWYRKWGVNCVRDGVLCGTGWIGIGDRNDTTKFNPVQLDHYDFSFSELKASGVYDNLICFWIDPLRRDDKDKVLAFAEAKNKASELENFAVDIQDLRIAAIVSLLNHKNPYTGLAYAQDPALACIEIRNEQDIFWYTVATAVNSCPTYVAKIRKDFCDWLRARYGGQEALVKAWGKRCLGVMPGCAKDEGLDRNSLHPVFNAWYFSTAGLASQEANFGARRRLLDTAEYLFETQNKYYARFAKAIRATGYRGILVGSNWQAGDGVSHMYNLLSDRLVGRIDRHNYFGGSAGWGMNVGVAEDNSSMLWQPGRELLSTGLQQLADRPFALSEWMCQAPNEWVAEGSPVIGFYGFGLQGWAAAFEGNNFAPRFEPAWGNWLNVQSPLSIGLYPAVTRSIFRGDVKQGSVIAARRFSLEALRRGKWDFDDVVTQDGDVKTISSSVPQEALAAGRVVLELVDKPKPSLIPDMTRQLEEKVVVSNTGQLEWHYPCREESYFTVNTDGSKGLVGFAPNKEFVLGDVRMQVDNKFAVLLLTALDKGKSLADTRSALITAVARARNTGMTYNESRSLTAVGTAPILLEPVLGSVAFGRKVAKVYLLDHDGKHTEQTAKLEGEKVIIDGASDKTMYYEAVFQ